MFWNRSVATILQRWQSEIDHSVETGQTPLLQLGKNSDLLDALPGMVALQAVIDRHALVNTPLILSGGGSAAWLWMLWLRRTTAEESRGSGVRIVFGGADAATMIASAAVTGGAEADRQHYWREVRPLALASHIEPESQPAVATSLENMPVDVMNDEGLVAENSLQDLVAWLAVALVLIVIVIAALKYRSY